MKEVRQRYARRTPIGAEGGFTMVELLVVVAILGILLAIAVPSYLGYKGRAADGAAKSNLRAALPSVEAYHSDTGGYSGMTMATLKASYDSGIAPGVSIYGVPTATTYCITDTEEGHAWSLGGSGYKPNGTCA
jgi:type IV pilus assembly protein PilA